MLPMTCGCAEGLEQEFENKRLNIKGKAAKKLPGATVRNPRSTPRTTPVYVDDDHVSGERARQSNNKKGK